MDHDQMASDLQDLLDEAEERLSEHADPRDEAAVFAECDEFSLVDELFDEEEAAEIARAEREQGTVHAV